jgi:hypothetical protein
VGRIDAYASTAIFSFSPGVFSEHKIEAFALLVTCVGLLAHTFFLKHNFSHQLLFFQWPYQFVAMPASLFHHFKAIYQFPKHIIVLVKIVANDV